MGNDTKDKVEEVKIVEKFDAMKEIQRNFKVLDSTAEEDRAEKIGRLLRSNSKLKKRITKDQLISVLSIQFPDANENIFQYAKLLPDNFNVDSSDNAKASQESCNIVRSELPEINIYLYSLMLAILLGNKDWNTAAKECALFIAEESNRLNLRTIDVFSAKAYSSYSLCHQQTNTAPSIRYQLLAAHRTACLRHDEIGQATLLNLLLGNFLSQNLYEQASKLVSKTTFPENASNNQFVRYLYYVGRIQAIQLDYTEAHTKLMQAIRKAPQHTALGFHLIANKLAIIVQLLMGDVPERAMFSQPRLKNALVPYMELTNAVRVGDLLEFNAVMESNANIFKQDKTESLILRLRHNVIKTGLRKINLSYSCISFEDISKKLVLDTPENAEFVCAKAIRDGVIDAVIDHGNGWMQSKEMVDVYGTLEPQQAFHKRTTFCLDVHNEAVKAMRYPPDAYKKELESSEERLEREKQEDILQQELKDDTEEGGI